MWASMNMDKPTERIFLKRPVEYEVDQPEDFFRNYIRATSLSEKEDIQATNVSAENPVKLGCRLIQAMDVLPNLNILISIIDLLPELGSEAKELFYMLISREEKVRVQAAEYLLTNKNIKTQWTHKDYIHLIRMCGRLGLAKSGVRIFKHLIENLDKKDVYKLRLDMTEFLVESVPGGQFVPLVKKLPANFQYTTTSTSAENQQGLPERIDQTQDKEGQSTMQPTLVDVENVNVKRYKIQPEHHLKIVQKVQSRKQRQSGHPDFMNEM